MGDDRELDVVVETPFLNGFTLNLFFGYTLCYAWESFRILPHSSSGPHNGITNCKGKINFSLKIVKLPLEGVYSIKKKAKLETDFFEKKKSRQNGRSSNFSQFFPGI